jgi:hypothetical protein
MSQNHEHWSTPLVLMLRAQEWTWWVFGSRAVKDGRSVHLESLEDFVRSLRPLANAAMLSVTTSTGDEPQGIVMRRLGKPE